jgi:hypothetical protein
MEKYKTDNSRSRTLEQFKGLDKLKLERMWPKKGKEPKFAEVEFKPDEEQEQAFQALLDHIPVDSPLRAMVPLLTNTQDGVPVTLEEFCQYPFFKEVNTEIGKRKYSKEDKEWWKALKKLKDSVPKVKSTRQAKDK